MDIKRIDSDEGNVSKFVFTSEDMVAEAVLYKYPTYSERTVICCSTMSGCPMGCRFCGAGDYYARNLAPSEIVDQVDYALAQTGINPNEIERLQIMFMSMGEPMLNARGLIGAIRRLHVKYPHAALLVSTSAPDVDFHWFNQLSVEVPTVGLQFSVHESTDEARDKLIPFKAKMTLAQMSEAGEQWHRITGRRPFFNYCAHDDNTTDKDVQRLSELFPPEVWECTISVVCERSEGLPARNTHQQSLATKFSSMMLDAGYNVRVFDPAGQDDIGGGCGQLWFVQQWMHNNPDKVRPSVGFGKQLVHVPVLTKP